MGWFNWVLVFAGFSMLIVLHEFGHFIVAKWTGMRVERFFLFFPPRLWSFKRGETEYGIGWIPLGGFVKITGMNPDEVRDDPPPEDERTSANDLLAKIEAAGQEDDDHLPDGRLRPEVRERAYYAQPVWKRIATIAAGPVMNILIAFVILFALAFSFQKATALDVAVIEDDAAAKGVLQEGDKLLAIDGVALDQGGSNPSTGDLDDRANTFANQLNTHTCAGAAADGCRATTPATLRVERDGEVITVKATPVYDADAPPIEDGGENGRFRLGFAFGGADPVDAGYTAPEAADWAVDRMWFVTERTVSIFSRIFQSEERKQLSGVVGVSAAGNEAINAGAFEAFALLALVSLSLAIINLFPFLPLDGGHIFWSLVEKVRGKRPSMAAMERGAALGFALVLMLALIGLTNDLDRLMSGEGFGIR
jgi:regulator of sigma E protease